MSSFDDSDAGDALSRWRRASISGVWKARSSREVLSDSSSLPEAAEAHVAAGDESHRTPIWHGHLDFVSSREAYGWAADNNQPTDALVYVNGHFHCKVRGNHYRSDLHDNGVSADAGFNVEFATELSDGDEIHVTFSDGTPLTKSPQIWHAAPLTGIRAGHLDSASKDEIVGWATVGNQVAEIRILVNGSHMLSAKGGDHRDDLAQLGIPPDAGFRIALREPLADGDKVVATYADGVPFGQPYVVGALNRKGHLDIVNESMIEGWASEGDEAGVVSIHVNQQLVSTVKGGIYRADLEHLGLPANAGFVFNFPGGLKSGDEVHVAFADGKQLVGSPRFVLRSSEAARRARSPNERPLLFMHVPKTAGTSLRRFIDHQMPDRLSLYNGELGDFNIVNILRKSSLPQLIMGHFSFGTHEYLNVPPNYTCVMRDPIDRVMSLYNYCRSLPEPAFALYRTNSLQDLIEKGLTEQTNNHVCRLCSGVSSPPGVTIRERWLLDLALFNIEHYFGLVGTVTRLSEYTKRLSSMFGWSADLVPVENVTKGARAHLDSATMEVVRAYNALDLELFKIIEERAMVTPAA